MTGHANDSNQSCQPQKAVSKPPSVGHDNLECNIEMLPNNDGPPESMTQHKHDQYEYTVDYGNI